jgi:PAS domain S-box-containing protein
MSQLPLDDVTLRHLAQVVESSEDAIVSKDLDGTIRSWNRAAARMFGYTAAEAVGRSIRMIIPADRQAEEDAVSDRIRTGEAVGHFETIRQRKDGTLIPVSLTVSPIHDEAGHVVGSSKIARDITDRTRADAATRRLAAVVDWSDDAIITKTPDSLITSWNPAAERMFGYTPAEAIGQSIRMLIPPALQQEEDAVLAKIQAGVGLDHFETVRRRKDGALVSISLTVSPLRNEQGEIVGASTIARDITERSRLLALAREQAAITEQLGDVGAVVAGSLDRDTILHKVTDTATALTHAECGAFLYNVRRAPFGDSDLLYTVAGVPKGAFAGFPQPWAPAVFGPTCRGEGTIRLDDVTQDPRYGQHAPDGSLPAGPPPVRSYLTVPVTDVHGDVLGELFFGHSRVGMFTAQHARVAEKIAAWASVALENSRLYDETQDANRMKDEFLAILSHELRTPLNAIVGYARLLRGGILTGEKAARGLETLDRNATWLTQIVEDVLDVSRIVSGKIRLDVQPVELPVIVDNAVATVQPAADAKGVRLQAIIDPNVGPVAGDPDRLQQVIWNLLGNAVKFTPKRGRIQVRLERVDSHIDVVVSDTGAGIRADFLPYVFERFRQEDAGTTRKTGGLGLGLALVRHIVEMHGGTVHAASGGRGQGATFRVRFPVMVVHPAGVTTSRVHPRTDRMTPLSGLDDLHGIHVLAVDDDADTLTLLRVVLEAAGAEVTTILSPLAALERIEAVRPHVIVVDLGMPEMDGFALIARIRASPHTHVREVPAAALTAFARSEDRTKALRSGFDMHLAKPVDPGELVASVATLAKRARTSV